ncbi:transcriptional regulator PAI 2-type, partial [Lentinula lateritia]
LLPTQTMILFNSPHHHYINLGFYIKSKLAIGKVVLTWDYTAVQVYGQVWVYYLNNEETNRFLDAQVENLTDMGECKMLRVPGKNNTEPWKITDTPLPYLTVLEEWFMGIKIKIQSIAGKFKMSQELQRGG